MFLAAPVYRGIALATVSPISSWDDMALGGTARTNTNRHVLSLGSRSSKFYDSTFYSGGLYPKFIRAIATAMLVQEPRLCGLVFVGS